MARTLVRCGSHLAVLSLLVTSCTEPRHDAPPERGSNAVRSRTELDMGLPSTGSANDEFGRSVATDGTYAVVGAPGTGLNEGTVYVFDIDAKSRLSELGYLSYGASESRFGDAVALSGTTALIGTPLDDGPANDSGTVYVYDVETFDDLGTLTASDASKDDWFGASVAVRDTMAVVGATYGVDDAVGETGAAYVFDQDVDDEWSEVAKLLPSDGAEYDFFGTSVAVDGDTVVVGATDHADNGQMSGAVYVYGRDEGGPGAWGEVVKLLASDGYAGDGFGWSVSLDGYRLAVTAPYHDHGGTRSGAVYLFEPVGDTWEEVLEITPSDGADQDRFGWSCSLDGDTLVVGATGDYLTDPYYGAAYVFLRDEGGTDQWGEFVKLTPSSGDSNLFGMAVAAGGGLALVGAMDVTENGPHSGAAYVFAVTDAGPQLSYDNTDVDEDEAVIVYPFDNDSDPDGDTLVLDTLGTPEHGTVTDQGDGTIRYVPDPDWNGLDSFTYDATDETGNSATAWVEIYTNPVADPPVAYDDSAIADEDGSVYIALVANDSDADGDALSIQTFFPPGNGTITSASDVGVTYAPSANFFGTDAFSYEVTDGTGNTAAATVTITVNPVDDPPVANDDAGALDEDGTLVLAVLGNDTDADGDVLVIATVGEAGNGTVTTNGDGTLTYTPAADFNGTDAFTYTVDDGHGTPDEATVTVQVAAINDPPAAGDDDATVLEDGSVEIDVLANDSDPEGEALHITGIGTPLHGTITNGWDGTMTYTPDPDFFGEDGFSYEVADDSGAAATAIVAVDVGSADEPPEKEDPGTCGCASGPMPAFPALAALLALLTRSRSPFPSSARAARPRPSGAAAPEG